MVLLCCRAFGFYCLSIIKSWSSIQLYHWWKGMPSCLQRLNSFWLVMSITKFASLSLYCIFRLSTASLKYSSSGSFLSSFTVVWLRLVMVWFDFSTSIVSGDSSSYMSSIIKWFLSFANPFISARYFIELFLFNPTKYSCSLESSSSSFGSFPFFSSSYRSEVSTEWSKLTCEISVSCYSNGWVLEAKDS